MLFFTSDLHFGHENVIRFNDRPFESAEHMNEQLIKNINSTVSVSDELYILGDFSYKISQEEAIELAQKINCPQIHLIRGNHDKRFENTHVFSSISDYKEIKVEGLKIVLFHYPISSWNGAHHNSLHLHGHIHSEGNDYNMCSVLQGIRRWDVGVDANKYHPVSLDEILFVHNS